MYPTIVFEISNLRLINQTFLYSSSIEKYFQDIMNMI